jgi:L-iditol 2-dehydrogenase
MKAVVLHAPMDFCIEDHPDPGPEKGGLLLQVHACGLCGSDLRTLLSGHPKVTLPWIIGHEISGTLIDTGTDYDGAWEKGDMLAVGPVVYCGMCDFCLAGRYELCENYEEIAQKWPGGFAEYIAIPQAAVKRGLIQRVPPGVEAVYAPLAEPLSSCISAQEKGEIGWGDTVVIIGAGPIGCIHIALARARGAFRIIIADILSARLHLAQTFEPDRIINAADLNVTEEVLHATDGRGADVVITASPAPEAIVQATEMAKKGGRILIFGGLPKDSSKPAVDFNLIHYRALHLIGATIFAPRHFQSALRFIASGRFPLEKLVTHQFPLSEFTAGAELALAGKGLKFVFLP